MPAKDHIVTHFKLFLTARIDYQSVIPHSTEVTFKVVNGGTMSVAQVLIEVGDLESHDRDVTASALFKKTIFFHN